MLKFDQPLCLSSTCKRLLGAFFVLICCASLVAPAQANDNFPGTTITGNSGSLNASNGTATGQTGEPLTYNGGSLNTMWYSWTAPSNGTLTVQTCGGTTNFDTTLQTFTGATVGGLTQLATNDDSCGMQSVNTVSVTSGTTYRIQVDGYGSATGSFTLSWSFVAASGSADLSLTQTVSTTTPQSGARLDYTLTVTNNSTSTVTATGIQVSNILNASLIYRSQTGTGTFDPATSIWTVGSLAPGASATKVITVANNAVPGTTISNYAQITASSASDPDSTVNNGSTTEDDDESTSITIANFPPAGTPPALTCPVASAIFDWDAQAWTSGALTGSFNVANIGPMALNFTGATNRFIADPTSGSATPVRNTSTTGGATGQNSLMLAVDLANTSESVNATWTFTNGVSGLQFTLSDIDLLYGQFEDSVTVTGSYKGVAVTPTLTNFGANTVSGNSATATALATNTNADGNVRVTFSSPVDTVTVNYGSTAGAPADPGIQAIALMDMTVCGAATDLALTKQVSNSSPSTGAAISYTLTATNTTANAMDTSGVTVSDVLPAGFTFVSATGTGSYNNGTGVWTIGTLAKGATATLTINGTVSASAGTTVTNIAQITASSLADPDSTVNNGVTTEDDYASVAFTVPSTFNCPTGSTATGSGYATGGTGQYQNQIFWLDWSCGGTTTFPIGSTINKSWNAGDGLVITAQVNNITGADLVTHSTGNWIDDLLDNMYPNVNPLGLGGTGGADPSFRTTYTATLNGVAVSLRYVLADAEITDAGTETMASITTGTSWQLLEKQGGIVETLSGSNASWTGGGNPSSLVLETSGTTVQLDNSIIANGGQFFAFGVFTPFDFSDAPTTATSYGAANHRTVSSLRMGSAFTNEASAYDSPTASADADDAVTLPSLFRSQAASINVPVSGPGYLSAWADWNDDGDFADVGEKYASDAVDGGSGDADATVNGVIVLSVTPPATAATTATIGRFRYSSQTGAPISGLYGFGEVEDYPLTVIQPRLDVTKTSYIVTDYVSATNPKSIPGALVRYCILVTNSGSAPATGVAVNDALPGDVTYVPGSMLSASGCSATATAEDDDAAGPDESDPFGMSITGTTITGTAATLATGASYALIFNAVVD